MAQEKGVGVVGGTAIGIGGMVGGGIFAVLGTAATIAGGGTPVAFAIAGGGAALTAVSYSRLSVRYPSQGGTVVFVHRASGADLCTGTVNLALWLSCIVTISPYAAAFGSYGATFFVPRGESVPAAEIARAKDYALAEAALPALGETGFTLVSVAAVLATFPAINATVHGNARLGFTLARDGEMPELLERRAWGRPVGGVLLTAGLSSLLANTVDLQTIAILGSAGFLLIFAVVKLSAWRLRRQTGGGVVVRAFGALACSASFVTLIVRTARDDLRALPVVVGMFVISLLFELIYPFVSGRKLRVVEEE